MADGPIRLARERKGPAGRRDGEDLRLVDVDRRHAVLADGVAERVLVTEDELVREVVERRDRPASGDDGRSEDAEREREDRDEDRE